jgi:hypothetical protein
VYREGLILPGEPVFFARLKCGGCADWFDGNPHTVPNFRALPCCRNCWDLLNALRVQANMEPWDRPDNAYPPE